MSSPAPDLPPATASVIGSFPGTDPREVARIVAGELPDLPVLSELPARGPGADMIGRTLALIATHVSPDFAGQTTTSGWRLAGNTTGELPRSMRRATSWLGEDCDIAESLWADYQGVFKLQIAGPWTLAAAVELANGERVLSDDGARRDLAAALTEAVGTYLADVQRRLPRSKLMLQLDEPALPAVIAGAIKTQSGWSRHREIDVIDASAALRGAVGAAHKASAFAAVHCCGSPTAIGVMADIGADAVSIDLSLVGRGEVEEVDQLVGELTDAGRILMAGLPVLGRDVTSPNAVTSTLAPLTALLGRLAIPIEDIAGRIVVTPACGLAGAQGLEQVRQSVELLNSCGAALRGEQRGASEREGRRN